MVIVRKQFHAQEVLIFLNILYIVCLTVTQKLVKVTTEAYRYYMELNYNALLVMRHFFIIKLLAVKTDLVTSHKISQCPYCCSYIFQVK